MNLTKPIASFLLATLLSFGASTCHASNWDIYAEATNLDESPGYAASVRLKKNFVLDIPLTPYLAIQWESYQPSSAGKLRRISPMLGLEKAFGPVRLFADYRYDLEEPKSTYSKHDPRFGLTGGYWKQGIASVPQLFSDSYGELISIPRINWRPNLLVQTKFGWRSSLKNFYFDPFVELYAKQSGDPLLGSDAFESRGGIRFVVAGESWSSSLNFFHRIYSFRNTTESKFRVLFAAGASF